MGKDTHALSGPAQRTALEVLAANGVETVIQRDDGFTPTPVISHAILVYNRGRKRAPRRRHRHHAVAQPARRRRLQVQPAQRRPGRHRRHQWIQDRANDLLRGGNAGVKRVPFASGPQGRARRTRTISSCPTSTTCATSSTWTRSARPASSSASIRSAARRVHYWEPINEIYGLDITVVNPTVDPTFSFMTVDHDGKIRMDCSSPYAMARLVGSRTATDVAFGNDPDSDRHGIVTPSAGLMNPNHYLAVAIRYLLTHRPELAGARPRSARRWSAAA